MHLEMWEYVIRRQATGGKRQATGGRRNTAQRTTLKAQRMRRYL